jgi:hypothetical protein
MSTSIMINNVEYPAEISGVLQNPRWDRRDTKSITLEMTHEVAAGLFVDGVAWSIVYREKTMVPSAEDANTLEEQETTEVYDNSDYCVAGTITDNRDGSLTVLMGKKTEVELLQEAKDDAELAAQILLGEAE